MATSFAYARPTSLRQAVELLALPGARAHAGETDLLGCLRDRVFRADTVVSLSALPELKGISERPDGSLRVGSLTTLAELAGRPRIRERHAALAQGAASAASPQSATRARWGATCASGRAAGTSAGASTAPARAETPVAPCRGRTRSTRSSAARAATWCIPPIRPLP